MAWSKSTRKCRPIWNVFLYDNHPVRKGKYRKQGIYRSDKMSVKKINGLCFICLCLCVVWPVVSVQAQQSAQFTQYMFNPIVINPAYTGADEALKLTLINRSQWVSVDGAPATQGIYANSLFKRKRIGIGLSFINDKIGVHKNQDLRGMVAYHLPVSNEATFS